MPILKINIAPAGTPEVNGQPSLAGHMWYTIDEGDGSPPTNYGFVPQSEHSPAGAGKIVQTDGDTYTGTIFTQSVQISQAQYNTLQAFGNAGVNLTQNPGGGGVIFGPNGISFNTYYNVLDNSCIDFTWNALATIGIYAYAGQQPIPSGNEAAVSAAIAQFQQFGGSTSDTPISVYDNQNNLISTSIKDANGNTILQSTYQYPNGNSVTDTTTNALGQTVEKSTESVDPTTQAEQIISIGYSATTGTQLNEQQIISNPNGLITDSISGQGANASLNNATITLAAGAVATNYGSGNTVTGSTGSQLTDDQSNGTSSVETFDVTSPGGQQLSSETKNYSGPDGTGTDTSNLLNFANPQTITVSFTPVGGSTKTESQTVESEIEDPNTSDGADVSTDYRTTLDCINFLFTLKPRYTRAEVLIRKCL